MKTVFSGIKPTGNPHIGNYIGSIYNSLQISKENKCFFSVVDLHALTVEWDPKELSKLTKEVLITYLAAGFDLNNCNFFLQSQNHDHSYLTWIFNCITPDGWMNNMIEYKQKQAKYGGKVTVGLYDYPVLMAADILLYDADLVPVGIDQTQHVEVTRDIAEKFNFTFGETFKIPEVVLMKFGSNIRSLQHPEKKMSKSDNDSLGTIYMLDNPDDAVKKVLKSVTDSEASIGYDPENRIAVSNLIDIYTSLTDKNPEKIVKSYEGKGYADFKKDLAQIVHDFLQNYQVKYRELESNPDHINDVVKKGLEAAQEVSSKKIIDVKEKIGLLSEIN